jgi:2-keto-4-pentenoate hydratase/2-oxohepta-3-ene-1,7-dioic acid hydratase in catechol pathway
MKLATFSRRSGPPCPGVVIGSSIVDISLIVPDIISLIGADEAALAAVARVASAGVSIPLEEVRLLAPVPRPPEFIGIGLNYRDHAAEVGMELPAVPTVFNKEVSCIAGPYDDIQHPGFSDCLDYEAELGIVVGRAGRHLSVAAARAAIFGYVIVNDLSVRDVQFSSPTHVLGKSFDTHGPFGPWIVTSDEIGDPQSLAIEARVGEQVVQRGTTADMIMGCVDTVSFLSRFMTLLPGTLITTGTPAGVGMSCKPPRFLKVGEQVTVSIEKIGQISNRVVAAPSV